MNDENNSNNEPNITQDFTEVKDFAPKQEPEKLPIIATKAELDMRKDVRQETTPELHLTIGGVIEQAVHQQEFDDNERMIEYLESRLEQTDLNEEFDRTR